MRETFKERMKRIRVRAGFKSQQDAATAIGCERGTVSMWEAPSSTVRSVEGYLLDVARAYKVRPDWVNNLDSVDDGFPWAQSNAPGSSSQSARLDERILDDALQVIRGAAQWEGGIDAPPSAREIAIAYALIEESKQRVSGDNIVTLVKAFLERKKEEPQHVPS